MFHAAYNFTGNGLELWETSAVTRMNNMFSQVRSTLPPPGCLFSSSKYRSRFSYRLGHLTETSANGMLRVLLTW